MSHFRGSALLAGMVAIATVLALGGPVDAAPTVTPAVAPAASPAVAAAAVPGQPPANSPMRSGNYFSYPNRKAADRANIRNRVLATVNSTWGAYTVQQTDPVTGEVTTVSRRGSIKMATWSFNDMTMRNALVRAAQRGVQVQIIAAEQVNRVNNYKPWKSLRATLNSAAFRARGNFAGQCAGACRGSGGTPHSKYFLFDDVGASHVRNITVQTSMNLTLFAMSGQWNQAAVLWNPTVYRQFLTIFTESTRNRSLGAGAYRRYLAPNVISYFYPGGGAQRDPIMQALNQVRCTGGQSGTVRGRTRVRVINYAIYDKRGVALAKKLRSLWNAGCNVAIIYGVTSRPVLKVLRSKTGRGRVPMKQSVIKNSKGEIVKYNHSKWVAITGKYGNNPSTWTVNTGSANLSDFAYRGDEQMQQLFGYGAVAPYIKTFDTTWRQGSSRPPKAGGPSDTGARALNRIPQEPTFGKGIYKYMSEGG